MVRKNQKGLEHTIRSSLPSNRENMRKAGKKAHRNGLTLEKAVEAYAEQVLDNFDENNPLKAEIYRNHDAMQKARGRNGGITAFTTGVSPCDFSFFANVKIYNYITAGMIEAKSRNKQSINKSAISHHQKDQLMRIHKLGHVALVLVSLTDNNDEQHFYLCPITNWYRGKKKSLNLGDLNKIAYKCKTVSVWDSNQKEHLAPDIIEVLDRIDEDFEKYDDYFPVPDAYREQYDNRKMKNPIYSTIDKDMDEDDPAFDL